MKLTARQFKTILGSAATQVRPEEHRDSTRMAVTEGDKATASSDLVGAMDVRVQNLSRTGVCIRASKLIPLGDTFNLELSQHGSDPMVQECEVVRSERLLNGSYDIGAEFVLDRKTTPMLRPGTLSITPPKTYAA